MAIRAVTTIAAAVGAVGETSCDRMKLPKDRMNRTPRPENRLTRYFGQISRHENRNECKGLKRKMDGKTNLKLSTGNFQHPANHTGSMCADGNPGRTLISGNHKGA